MDTYEIPHGYCHCGCGQQTFVRNGIPNKFVSSHHLPSQRTRAALPLEKVANHFWKKVNKDGPIHPVLLTECWLWIGTKQSKGYGQFWDGTKVTGAHQFSYLLTYGVVPEGLYICHHCDQPGCVRPDHLFAGTPIQNLADMVRKERGNKPQGERHGLARFTNEQAKKLREQYEQLGTNNMAQFAKMHNVPDETMRRLINRETYKNV